MQYSEDARQSEERQLNLRRQGGGGAVRSQRIYIYSLAQNIQKLFSKVGLYVILDLWKPTASTSTMYPTAIASSLKNGGFKTEGYLSFVSA